MSEREPIRGNLCPNPIFDRESCSENALRQLALRRIGSAQVLQTEAGMDKHGARAMLEQSPGYVRWGDDGICTAINFANGRSPSHLR